MENINPVSPSFRGGQVPIRLADDTPGVGLAGQMVLLALTPDDVHDPTEITSYLAGYKNADYMADVASPVILRNTDNDKFRTFDEDDAFLRVNVKGSIQGSIPEVDPKSALKPYSTLDRFVGSFVSDRTEQNATAYNARQAAGRRCARALLMDREVDVFGGASVGGLLCDPAKWHASVKTVLDGTTKWNGGAGSNPIKDLKTRIRASLAPVTDVFMNLEVTDTFFDHSTTKDFLQMHLGALGAKDLLREFSMQGAGGWSYQLPTFFGTTFHVTAAKFKENTADTPGYIMGNHVVLTRRPPGGVPVDGEEIATTYTFRSVGAAMNGFETRQFRVEGRGPKGGTMVVVAQADIALMTGTKVGGFIESVVQ
jgi:hypothetical protein